MAESEAKDLVLVWVEDLHRRAGSMRFWEEEKERIDLEMCCLILSSNLWERRPTYRLSQWHANGYNTMLFCEAVRTALFVAERSSLVEYTTRVSTWGKALFDSRFYVLFKPGRNRAEP